MTSLYRPATGALLDATSRRAVSASFSHSSTVSSTITSAKPLATPRGREVFDIFDVPAKLRERNHCADSWTPLRSFSTSHVTPRAGASQSKNIYGDALGLPWSLPSPVTFDGPACPPHMSPSSLKKRRLQRQTLTPSSRGVHGCSTISFAAFKPQSKPLNEVFDGPSRIARYPYPASHNGRHSFTYVSLALCISSAFGWLALKDNLDLQQKRST